MRVFLAAAETGSVSLAAAKCNLSQPAATQAIAGLEQDLGTALLGRQRKQFFLTDCGAIFRRRAQTALSLLRSGAQTATRLDGTAKRSGPSFDQSITAAQLRNLIAISNTGSFTVAAQSLGLSQPTMHRTARGLEAVSGIALFTAGPTGVRLTPAAEVFVRATKLAQAEIRQGLEEISHALGADQSTFVLGSLPLARTEIVPKAIHAMVTHMPGTQVQVIDGRYSELLKSLREGEIDCLIGALRDPPPADDVHQEVLFQDALAVVTHPNHPLASGGPISLEDTLAFPWIAPPKNTPAGQYLFETLRIQDRDQTPVRVVSSSLALLRGMLAEGPYVSIISRHQIHVDEALGTIAPLQVTLRDDLRDIGLTTRQNWRPTDAQTRFLNHLRQISRDTTE